MKIKIDLDFASGLPKINLYDKPNDTRELIIVNNFNDLTKHMQYSKKKRFIRQITKNNTKKKKKKI